MPERGGGLFGRKQIKWKITETWQKVRSVFKHTFRKEFSSSSYNIIAFIAKSPFHSSVTLSMFLSVRKVISGVCIGSFYVVTNEFGVMVFFAYFYDTYLLLLPYNFRKANTKVGSSLCEIKWHSWRTLSN